MWEGKGKGEGEGKGKVKFHPRAGHEVPEGEWSYNRTLSLTSALDGLCGQHQAPAALPLVKIRYPLYRRLGGPQGRSGRVRKIFPHRDSIDGPSRLSLVATPTTLSLPNTVWEGYLKNSAKIKKYYGK